MTNGALKGKLVFLHVVSSETFPCERRLRGLEPLCVCGRPMQRSPMPQVLSYLDFLRGRLGHCSAKIGRGVRSHARGKGCYRKGKMVRPYLFARVCGEHFWGSGVCGSGCYFAQRIFAGFDCESTGGQSDGGLGGLVSLGAGATSENRRSSVGLDSGAPGQAAARAVR
jgi:hypothetical protein